MPTVRRQRVKAETWSIGRGASEHSHDMLPAGRDWYSGRVWSSGETGCNRYDLDFDRGYVLWRRRIGLKFICV